MGTLITNAHGQLITKNESAVNTQCDTSLVIKLPKTAIKSAKIQTAGV